MPDWIEKYRAEGMEDADIDQAIKEKQAKYIEKYGNKSRVGILLNSCNQAAAQQQLLIQPKKYGRTAVNPFDEQVGGPGNRARLSSLPTIADRNASAAPGHRNYRNKSLSLT